MASAGPVLGDPAQLSGGHGMWPLTEESRAKIVQRIAGNLAAISFFSTPPDARAASASPSPARGAGGGVAARLDDEAAREHALVIEREAFMAADTHFRGGAGGAESAVVLLYAQHASDAMIALLKAKMAAPPSPAPATRPTQGGGAELDLSEGNVREFVGQARAEELLRPMLQAQPNGHHKVKLSTKSFKPEAAPVVARALRAAESSLRHLDLSDTIAGQPEDDALAALVEMAGAWAGIPLLSLDLSNNALGEKGIRACAQGLSSQRCLESLFFQNDGISAEAGQAIVELLPPECATSLTTLHFHNNCTGDEGAVALAELVGAAAASRLQDLRFSSTRVQTEGGIALAEAIAKGSGLVRLDLRDNMLGEEGADALASALRNHPGLKELYLADTTLGNDGACTILKAVSSSCTQLEVLDLSGNEVTAEGAQRMAGLLEGLPLLRRLALCDNELQDEGAAAIARVLPLHNKRLEELELSTNEIEDKGALAAVEAACELPEIKLVNVNGNSISKAGIAKITEALVNGCSKGDSVLGPLDENDDGDAEEED